MSGEKRAAAQPRSQWRGRDKPGGYAANRVRDPILHTFPRNSEQQFISSQGRRPPTAVAGAPSRDAGVLLITATTRTYRRWSSEPQFDCSENNYAISSP